MIDYAAILKEFDPDRLMANIYPNECTPCPAVSAAQELHRALGACFQDLNRVQADLAEYSTDARWEVEDWPGGLA